MLLEITSCFAFNGPQSGRGVVLISYGHHIRKIPRSSRLDGKFLVVDRCFSKESTFVEKDSCSHRTGLRVKGVSRLYKPILSPTGQYDLFKGPPTEEKLPTVSLGLGRGPSGPR